MYPAAGHTRFAHSLGVSFLAGNWSRSYSSSVAAVAHYGAGDSLREVSGSMSRPGHGPLSSYLREVREDAAALIEMAATSTLAALFAKVVRDQKVAAVFGRYELTEDDVHFVQELIFGDKSDASSDGSGRPAPAKHFLLRSSRIIGMELMWTSSTTSGGTPSTSTSPCPSMRPIDHVRAGDSDDRGIYTVAYPEKEVWNVYELFRTRFNLHKSVSTPRVERMPRRMLRDVLLSAEEAGFTYRGKKLSEAMDCLEAYATLTDMCLTSSTS